MSVSEKITATSVEQATSEGEEDNASFMLVEFTPLSNEAILDGQRYVGTRRCQSARASDFGREIKVRSP